MFILKTTKMNKITLLFTCTLLAACGGGGGSDSNGEQKSYYVDQGKTTSWTAQAIKTQAMMGYDKSSLVRWESPIEVNTNGIARVEIALDRYETLLGGLVMFTRISTTPTNGIVFVEGDARKGDNTSGCGNVTNSSTPGPSVNYTAEQIPGNMTPSKYNGVYYIHLGSDSCDDAKNSTERGPYASAIAEHELGHVLGLHPHFDGFNGEEGLVHPNFFNVMYNLYANPIGSTEDEMAISIVEVGQFGE